MPGLFVLWSMLQGRQDELRCVVEVMGEIDFGPGQAGNVFRAKDALLNQDAKDFIIRIRAAGTEGARAGFADQDGEIGGMNFEEADGLADRLHKFALSGLPFLHKLEWFAGAERDEDRIVINGGV